MKLIGKVLRFIETVRHLLPKQIFYQVLRRIVPKKNTLPEIKNAYETNDVKGLWVKSPSKYSHFINKNEVKILNSTKKLIPGKWNYEDETYLWNYNLNYFDFINSKTQDSSVEFSIDNIKDWFASSKKKNTLIEPYPLSLMIINIIKWAVETKKNDKIIEDLVYRQALYVEKNIEWHITGNHLFSNAKALFFAGLYFDSIDSKRWLKLSEDILIKEISIQILNDGGNFELSTMYHSLMLEDILDILNISRAYQYVDKKMLLNNLRNKSTQMLNWLEIMSFSDGKMSLFNDSAFNVSQDYKTLINYAEELGIRKIDSQIENEIIHLKETGYVKINKNFYEVIVDVAKLGPDFLPSHGHADTLTFEMFAFGEKIIVNGGTSTYAEDESRLNEKGTASHNTVVVDGRNSSDVWSSFRVGSRARPYDTKIKKNENSISIHCSHDGYKRFHQTHTRKWKFKKQTILIEDTIHGKFNNATASYKFHKDCIITQISLNLFLLETKNKRTIKFEVIDGTGTLKKDSYAEYFGKRENTNKLEIRSNGSKIKLKIILIK